MGDVRDIRVTLLFLYSDKNASQIGNVIRDLCITEFVVKTMAKNFNDAANFRMIMPARTEKIEAGPQNLPPERPAKVP